MGLNRSEARLNCYSSLVILKWQKHRDHKGNLG